MKVLFAALHLGYFRNFESVICQLAERGHSVHLTGDESEGFGGEALARRLASAYPTRVTWDQLPSLEGEPWFDAARRLRLGLDYVRVLGPQHAPKLRSRALERTPRIVLRASALAPRATRGALTRIERLMPRSQALEDYLRREAPEVVVLASLTYSRSQQLDLLKAARALGIPVAAAIMSWDHLSSKALLHLHPDLVIVWNDVQKREAVEMHGIDPGRVAVTGAQCYDQWFTRAPARSRDAFCRDMGLRPERPFVLWVHSALSPTPDPPEPSLVVRWIEALRRSSDPRLREIGVLVRPHPERLKEWAGIDLTRFEHVAFRGGNPIDADAKTDYFDALYHASAVAGLVTSAFLEAAVVGRPVLTFTLPEYRTHQEEMIHFQYLRTVAGGLLREAPTIEAHLTQLAEAVALEGQRDARNRRFLEAFIRPFGLDRSATPVFADALERLAGSAGRPDPSLEGTRLARSLVRYLAESSRVGVMRWLMNDGRTDAWDEHAADTERAVRERSEAKAARVRAKARRREERRRRDAWMYRGKQLKSALRRARHRTAVTVWRVLSMTGLKRGALGPAGKD
jgi:hypothetical protein